MNYAGRQDVVIFSSGKPMGGILTSSDEYFIISSLTIVNRQG